jgi:predicted nucleotidyltransferase
VCSDEQLGIITGRIVDVASQRLGEHLEDVLLYGSYARGDHGNESDIDIMILADVTAAEACELEQDLVPMTNQLDLEHDSLISLYVKDSATFHRWLDVLPFYKNVLTEGVSLVA